jgi:hypothetical protein
MVRLFVLTQNKITDMQLKDVRENLDVDDEIIYAPDEILKRWVSIPPEICSWDLLDYINTIFDWLESVSPKPYDLLLIEGDIVATCYIVNWMYKKKKTTCVTPVIRWITVGEMQADGYIVKKEMPQYVRFRKFFSC